MLSIKRILRSTRLYKQSISSIKLINNNNKYITQSLLHNYTLQHNNMSSITEAVNKAVATAQQAVQNLKLGSSSSSTTTQSATTEIDHSKKPFQRLPTNVKPTHYDLTLTPDLQNFTFNGTVIVDIQVNESTNTIVLNSATIDIDNVVILNGSDNTQYGTASATTDADTETATIVLSSGNTLNAGQSYKLKMDYRGTLNDQLKGFYRSKYTDEEGNDKYMAVTQFESTDARRALPCWDEPAVKATFTVNIHAPTGLTVVSNMPSINEAKSTLREGYTLHQFDRTPIMSTYLLAFVVGEFDYVEDKTSNGTLLRVYTGKGKKEQGLFALDTGKRALEFYNTYFNIPYPLPKMDQLAIPDFAAGAMENWGCITYREVALLVDEQNTSTQSKQNIALTVCHEIAHQWFGNIVTMEWWTHLWLNEGYATWMEHFCVDALFPEWKIWESYVATDYSSTLDLDSLVNSHAIEIDVGHPDEVDEIFDGITYAKGSAVIRMLENYLGSKAFQQGLTVYLNKYKYSNALTQDLWNVLESTSGKPVANVMAAWTKQVGYPLITVTSEPNVDNGNLTLKLSQHRFLADGSKTSNNQVWPVLLSYVVSGSQTVTGQLLNDSTSTVTIANGISSVPSYIKLNAGQTALYRTLYPSSMYAALKQAIERQDSSLTAADRLGLQNDAFALARAGIIPTTQALELAAAYINETDYNVWVDLSGNLIELGNILSNHADSDTYKYYSKFICSLYTPILSKIGWDKQNNETSQTSLLRSTIINVCGKYGHKQTIHTAVDKFQQYYYAVQSNDSDASKYLPADLRTAVYSMSVANGGILAYNNALSLFSKAELNEEKTRILRALGSSQSDYLLQQTLEFALSNNVRSQDAPSALLSVSNNRYGRERAWNFITQNWEILVERYGGGFALSRLISAADHFASNDKADNIETFFKTHQAPAAERAIKQTVERIRQNTKQLARDGNNVKQWLFNYTKDHQTGLSILDF